MSRLFKEETFVKNRKEDCLLDSYEHPNRWHKTTPDIWSNYSAKKDAVSLYPKCFICFKYDSSKIVLFGREPEAICSNNFIRGEAGREKELEKTFRTLVEQWREDTRFVSSITSIVLHPAYQRIIGLGSDVVPLILSELQQRYDQWFWALRAITAEDPVKSEDAGRIKKMAEAWLQWGRQKKYI